MGDLARCPFCLQEADFHTKREMDSWWRALWRRFQSQATRAADLYAAEQEKNS